MSGYDYEHAYTFEYDSDEKKVKEIGYDGDGNQSFYLIYEYDGDDNLLRGLQYANEERSTLNYLMEYDADGQKSKETGYLWDGSIHYTFEYVYDEMGNLISGSGVDYSDVETRYYRQYDIDGNVIEESGSGMVWLPDYGPAEVYKIIYEYAEGSLCKEIYYADGSLLCIYHYNVSGDVVRNDYYNADGSMCYRTEY